MMGVFCCRGEQPLYHPDPCEARGRDKFSLRLAPGGTWTLDLHATMKLI